MSAADIAVTPPRERLKLVGHGEAEQTLLSAFQSGRLPHAWLISGPRGIGKATLAYRFARFLLNGGSEGGLFGGPDDLSVPAESSVAHRVAAQAHPDLRVVERTANERTGKLRTEIVVDDVRDLSHFLRLTPSDGGWRIAIVDAADEMNRNAANALLKILEEPPDRAVLLVVSHAPGRLLPTIRSRCRKLVMKPLPLDQTDALIGEFLPTWPTAARAAPSNWPPPAASISIVPSPICWRPCRRSIWDVCTGSPIALRGRVRRAISAPSASCSAGGSRRWCTRARAAPAPLP